MFDLNPLTAISREVREWMGWIESNNKAREESVRTALKSLSIAVLEPRSYLAQLSTEARSRDIAKEQAISNLWHEATLDLQSVDRALAERCFAKAEYWVDPTKWDADKIQRYDITLESDSLLKRAFGEEARRAAQETLAAFDQDEEPGAPTWIVNGKRFWGKDRVEWLVQEVKRLLTATSP